MLQRGRLRAVSAARAAVAARATDASARALAYPPRVSSLLTCVYSNMYGPCSKYMQEMSKKIFDIVVNHPNSLLKSAVSYEASPPNHFTLRPRNVLSDPPDKLTSEVERLIEINKKMAEV
ncbi:hypothetical protein EVAR_88515_1 [Eumeta japonica]|uniref:Uncharacterized protein n=1 Tax=Eumeta variegata TaxID=151549 RepID=A0A4C1XW89_EUMVA|nr:hypothetical protein EVAR_88515_1 [Eumeta japonica]